MVGTGFIFLGSTLTFLKAVSWGAGICLASQIAVDVLNSEWLERVKTKVSVKSVKGFDLGNEHCTVLGITQYGKTYATLQTLNGLKEGVLFINPQLTKTPKSFIKASAKNTAGSIWRAVKMGQKVDYHTSSDLEDISKEINVLIKELYEIGRLDCRIVIDECHLLSMAKDKSGLNACKRLASTGLSRGFKTVFISQRPATMDNSFYTQSTKHIVFTLGVNDYAYLKTNGFPVEEMKSMTGGQKYLFCEFDQMNVKGAYKIG